jgi:hypothetical protein
MMSNRTAMKIIPLLWEAQSVLSINISDYLLNTMIGLNDTPGANASAAITAKPGFLHHIRAPYRVGQKISAQAFTPNGLRYRVSANKSGQTNLSIKLCRAFHRDCDYDSSSSRNRINTGGRQ